MSDDDELEKLAKAATPGPWSTHLVDGTSIVSEHVEIGTTCDSNNTERSDGYNVEYERMEADAAFIAAANPKAILRLIALARRGGAATGAGGDDRLALRNEVLEEAAKVAEDADGHFSVWGEDRNTRVAQQTCKDIADRIRALKHQRPTD